MIWLAVFAVLITLLVIWYLIRPLLRVTAANDRERRGQLQQLRERLIGQLNELDVEEADNNIDAAIVSDERRRLETELAKTLHELEAMGADINTAQEKISRVKISAAVIIFGISVPLIAAGLYAFGQRTTLVRLYNPEEASASAAAPPMVLEMVARLEKRLAEQPDDAAGWFRLGRAYAVLEKPDAAIAAYVHAYQLTPDDPQLLAEYAAYLYNRDPSNISSQVLALYTKLLKLAPGNEDALWFLGFAAYQKNDYKQALGYWELLLKGLPPQSKEAQHLSTIVAKTREKLKKK
ncbi:MAG: c-type cytochrome biogenesis protein CcmI [Gammaproteobacteria bacterium]|nr:c-type cytochrome biogenesis protein CcmI [Gammaproteobacteria bacterium]